jgi:hypothetical protein
MAYEADSSLLSTAKLRMSRAVLLLLYMPYWREQTQLYLLLSPCELNQWFNESAIIKEIVFLYLE